MATTVITGRDVTFTIGGNTFDAQATSATLTGEMDRQTYETLDGKVYKVIDNNFTFDIEMLADWGATGSLCEILWGVTESAPNRLAWTSVGSRLDALPITYGRLITVSLQTKC